MADIKTKDNAKGTIRTIDKRSNKDRTEIG